MTRAYMGLGGPPPQPNRPKTLPVRAYIGLGSNLDQPQQQLTAALHQLDQLKGCRYLGASSFYRSPPLGPQDQPDFMNAVAAIDTELKPLELLAALQQIEQQQGRQRLRHWGPRTLDLDLLLYGQHSIQLPDLQVPHLGLCQRDFVLVPLIELAGDLQLPDGSHLMQHRRRLGSIRLERLRC